MLNFKLSSKFSPNVDLHVIKCNKIEEYPPGSNLKLLLLLLFVLLLLLMQGATFVEIGVLDDFIVPFGFRLRV